MEKESREFNGHLYYRYPASPRKHLQLYFWPNRTDRKKYGLEALHREVWKAAHGAIPDGCVIHHTNENKLDNSLENLECLTREEHGKRHPQGTPDWLIEHLDRIRPQTAEWHRSEEGREWHRQHGVRAWAERKPLTKVCVFCHQPFETIWGRKTTRYCSRACEKAWNKAHKKDYVDGVCLICGAVFSAWKYSKQQTCSRKCAARWRVKEGRQGGLPFSKKEREE